MKWVLHNVQLVDGNRVDIVIDKGYIKQIALPGQGSADTIMDGTELIVSSGWIDLHVHAMSELSPYGDEIDDIGVKQGVTTIVDAGSCGADRIGMLYEKSLHSITKVFSFMNISYIGLERVDELSQLEWLDEEKFIAAWSEYKFFIVGLKARISRSVVKDMGVEPLKVARNWADKYGLPIMVHIGSGPPHISDVLSLLEAGDVITHFLNGKANNVFNEQGEPIEALKAALQRGVYLDVGHGTASFSFDVAEKAKAAGIHPHTISTDIYKNNRLNGPVYSLADTLSKFLLLGYTLESVIAMVTTNAAERIGHPELGCLQVGAPADLTLFSLQDDAKKLIDSEGQERLTNQYIKVEGVVTGGTYYAS